MIRRVSKGNYGYLKYRKITLIMKLLFVLLGILILMIAGVMATKSRNNLLTVVAVLSTLPLANVAVILFAVYPYKSRPREEYEKVKAIAKDGLLNTELIITSKTDRTMEINYAYIHPKGVLCYSVNERLNTNTTQRYIESMLSKNGVPTVVKVFKDFKPFLNRLSELEPIQRETCDEDLLRIEGVLRAIAI